MMYRSATKMTSEKISRLAIGLLERDLRRSIESLKYRMAKIRDCVWISLSHKKNLNIHDSCACVVDFKLNIRYILIMFPIITIVLRFAWRSG